MSQSRHQASRVDIQQLFGLGIWVDLDVLVRNPLDFKRYPDPLDERAKEYEEFICSESAVELSTKGEDYRSTVMDR